MPRPKKKQLNIKPIQDILINNEPQPVKPPYPSQFENITFTTNFVNTFNNNNCLIRDNENDYIPSDRLQLGSVIGEGEFGSVLKGTYTKENGDIINVAIKTLRNEQVEANKAAFLTEAQVMMKLNHHCIVKLIGLSLGNPLWMVQELVVLGSMLQYLTSHRERINPNYEFKIWAAQIACGMKYLEEQRFVHRDLAARNILLQTQIQVKISDFGLSRALGTDHDYYRAIQGGKWPIKWYAPESYNYGTFSHKSDVWSFGVTIWEMFSFGAIPYGELKGADAIMLIEAGKRLEKPEACSVDIYTIMKQCWAYEADQRPTFNELLDFFSSDTDYMNLREILPDSNLA